MKIKIKNENKLSPLLSFLILMSGSQKINLVFLYFLFHFYFIFDSFFIFSIFRTLGLGLEVIGHTVISVISDGVITTLIMELEKRVKGSETK